MKFANEAEFTSELIKAAQQMGWKVHHDLPVKREQGGHATFTEGDTGFPDVFLAKKGRIIAAELKMPGNKPSDEQREWLEAMGYPNAPDVFLWHPEDWDDILAHLRVLDRRI